MREVKSVRKLNAAIVKVKRHRNKLLKALEYYTSYRLNTKVAREALKD